MNAKNKVPISMDLLQCQGCGLEIPVLPNCGEKLACKNCGALNNKSLFFPIHKTLWVKGENITTPTFVNPKLANFNCINEYRRAVKFRKAIFRLSESQGQITQGQALAIFIAFWIDSENGVIKLLEGDQDYSQNKNAINGNNKQADWLAQIQIKTTRGQQPKNNNLVMFLDASVLSFCPNSYTHLLRDALRLRSSEYKKSGYMSAGGKAKSWERFYKVQRGVEASCRRLWKALFGADPPPPLDKWWLRVAHQQGLVGQS